MLRRYIVLLLVLACMLNMGCNNAASPAEQSASPAEQNTPPAEQAPPAEQMAYIAFINVGKADAALVGVGGEYYLIDTGTKESYPALDAALRALGVETLDGVFISHTHSDHMGGLKQLAEDYPIAMLYCAELSELNKDGEHKIVKRAEKSGLAYTLLAAGDVIPAGEGSFTVLGPLELNADDDNDNSLVLRFETGGMRALFTGDMQFAEERTLLANGVDVRADVLKVGNHGNPDATGEEFALAVGARVAVISTDTAEDTDSANARVIAALGGAELALTQDAGAYVLVRFFTGGTLHMQPAD